ncbi:MAG: sugar phosphate isomerase/epimerase family protein [Phycisphaerae bacterium]
MKLAFSTNAFVRFSLAEAIECVGRLGYGGVEILADKPHWYPDQYDAAEADRVASLLQRAKLAVSNVNANCTFGYWKDAPPEAFFEPSLVSPVARLGGDRIRMIQNTLQFAKGVGAENISITSGKALPTMPPDAAMKQLRESLGPVLEVAERLKVRVGIECEPGLLIEWAHELRDLIDRTGSKMLGANLDIGHSIVLGEDVAGALKLLDGRVWNCHIEDLPGRKHYHLIPGTGTMDWVKLKDALIASRYDRFLTVELYTYPDRPAEAAEQSLAYLETIFGEE